MHASHRNSNPSESRQFSWEYFHLAAWELNLALVFKPKKRKEKKRKKEKKKKGSISVV